jgi:hypothetical protein
MVLIFEMRSKEFSATDWPMNRRRAHCCQRHLSASGKGRMGEESHVRSGKVVFVCACVCLCVCVRAYVRQAGEKVWDQIRGHGSVRGMFVCSACTHIVCLYS